MADVELEALEPEGPQPLHGHRDHLGVSLRLLEPDELDAGLVELAVAPDLRLVVAEDVREVGEADRPRLVPEPGGDDARDLGRDVRAQREQPPALAVDQLVHLLLELDVRAEREHVKVLERRRDDVGTCG